MEDFYQQLIQKSEEDSQKALEDTLNSMATGGLNFAALIPKRANTNSPLNTPIPGIGIPLPVPTPNLPQRIGNVVQSGVKTAAGGVMDLIKKYFPPSEWGRAQEVMLAESGGNPGAVGDNYPIAGEVRPSYGLFQIRTFPGRPPPDQLVDPETNVRYASELWKSQGWKPWTTAVRMGFAS